MRCLGAQGFAGIFNLPDTDCCIGFIGSVIGAALGTIIQQFLPVVLKDFLPLDISTHISWMAIGQGIA